MLKKKKRVVSLSAVGGGAEQGRDEPPPCEHDTYETVKAKFGPRLSGKSP